MQGMLIDINKRCGNDRISQPLLDTPGGIVSVMQRITQLKLPIFIANKQYEKNEKPNFH